MDKTTQRVRQMYEQYPYPQGEPMLRAATDVRLLRSYLETVGRKKEQLHVLDAGCGRGVGVIPAAATQPDVSFVGADMNRVALGEAKAAASARGLTNLRFAEVDLMTLEGLSVPPGGFDVIYSSGVLHHLSCPESGLRKLTSVLAPHGVLVIMVYAKHGRAPLYRLREAVELLLPKELPLAEKIAPSRELARLMTDTTLAASPWENTPKVVDVEFVDQVLNVNETSYSVDEMWSLLSSASLHFLRWLEPADWQVESVLPKGNLRRLAKQLSPMDQVRFVEQSAWRTTLQLIVTHDTNAPRLEFRTEMAEQTIFAVHPEVQISMATRNLFGSQRIEKLSYQVRSQKPVTVNQGAFAVLLMVLRDQNLPFTGNNLVSILQDEGIPKDAAVGAIAEAVRAEVLYRPHQVDVVS